MLFTQYFILTASPLKFLIHVLIMFIKLIIQSNSTVLPFEINHSICSNTEKSSELILYIFISLSLSLNCATNPSLSSSIQLKAYDVFLNFRGVPCVCGVTGIENLTSLAINNFKINIT